ncbi:TetR family transcriptional regulator [Paucilactobacillus vaccinostercus DSM 20634]|uniref:TetR family transcriptional regulator n=1 Tax=Paucilactobacillus vaccinostercus DSM 20634 TaxID=1423813 RepID=A0A0R2AEE1_9LACO|nr:TetR/AcrR family transcriptional regulator [Paucilactobacillus vaccinostercus]KRM62651.1 TetR family transcriptional regulator [Paucilactobacillus vaccinostercus DSM 20634]
MANSKTDPRVIKTRNNLKKALVQLMKQYKVENISVQKITEKASITRGTFYLHYKDKQDFIERSLSEILDDFFDAVMIDGTDYLPAINTDEPIRVFSQQRAFKYIENEAETFDVLINNQENEPFFDHLYARLADYLQKFHQQVGAQFAELGVPVNLEISFIVSAELGLIKNWLRDGMIYTPRYMTQSIDKIFSQINCSGIFFTDFFVDENQNML